MEPANRALDEPSPDTEALGVSAASEKNGDDAKRTQRAPQRSVGKGLASEDHGWPPFASSPFTADRGQVDDQRQYRRHIVSVLANAEQRQE